jgi:hypothetical protein
MPKPPLFLTSTRNLHQPFYVCACLKQLNNKTSSKDIQKILRLSKITCFDLTLSSSFRKPSLNCQLKCKNLNFEEQTSRCNSAPHSLNFSVILPKNYRKIVCKQSIIHKLRLVCIYQFTKLPIFPSSKIYRVFGHFFKKSCKNV